MQISEKMTRDELRATLSLASIYGLRMLGMFLILPIFAIYAETLQGGQSHTLIGWALGAYGLMQVLLQLPFGIASDKFGRKKMIYLGLILFAIGSAVAAMATDIHTVIIGRIIQGAGAIPAVVTALVADLTREEHRTKAMAMIGSTIAFTFAVSLVAGPVLNRWIGVPGIFWLTAVLSIAAIFVVMFAVPQPLHSHFHSDAQTAPDKIKDVLRDTQLLRLNFGTFSLHAAQMAMFIVVPFALKKTGGLSEDHHWQIYLPVLLTSFVLMLPAIIIGEKRAKLKPVFIGAIGLMLLAQLLFSVSMQNFWAIIASLLLYFTAFNVLEASLPSLISKMAPAASKGTAIGVHNTAQSFGMFLGAALGGYFSQHYGYATVFEFCAALMAIWLILSLGMKTPPSVKTKMYHVRDLDKDTANTLESQIKQLAGIFDASLIAQENVLIVKIDNQRPPALQSETEQTILKLIEQI